MKPLESHPLFNPEIKVTEVPTVQKKPPPVVAGNDELNFSLFEQANQMPAEKRKSYTLTLKRVRNHVLKKYLKLILTT